MKMKVRPAWWLLLLALGSSAMGCAKDTYLEVRFTSSQALPEVRVLFVDLTLTANDGGTRHVSQAIAANGPIKLPAPAGLKPITFPASMALKLDTEEGALKVDASALGAQDQVVATGSTTTTIMHAQTWNVTINF